MREKLDFLSVYVFGCIKMIGLEMISGRSVHFSMNFVCRRQFCNILSRFVYQSGKNMSRILYLLFALFTSSAYASGFSIYEAEVPLEASTREAEQAAKKAAFSDVLVRASGQKSVLQNPTIKSALNQAQQYINQFGFTAKNGARYIRAGFDGRKIRNLLSQAKEPFWTEPRPEVLFWLVEHSGNQRNILWENTDHQILGTIKSLGQTRGLPTILPVGDFDDVVSISVNDLWGGFVSQISTASTRYQPRGVVLLRLASKTSMQWQFFPNLDHMEYEAPLEGYVSGSYEGMISDVIDQVANYYAESSSVLLGEDGADSAYQWLQVSGIQSSKDFFALERFLKSLSTVGSVQLAVLDKGNALLNVNLLAPLQAFESQLNNQRRLEKQLGSDVVLVPQLNAVDENQAGQDGINLPQTATSNDIHEGLFDIVMPSPFPTQNEPVATEDTQDDEMLEGETSVAQSTQNIVQNTSMPIYYQWR